MKNKKDQTSKVKSDLSREAEHLADELFRKPISKIVKETGIPALIPVLSKIFKENYDLIFTVNESKDLDESFKELNEESNRLVLSLESFKDERTKISRELTAERTAEFAVQRERLVGTLDALIKEQDLPEDGDDETSNIAFRMANKLRLKSIDTSIKALAALDRVHGGLTEVEVLMPEVEVYFTKTLINKYRRGIQLRNVVWTIADLLINAGLVVLLSALLSGLIGLLWTGLFALIMLFIFNSIKHKFISPWIKAKMQEWRRSNLLRLAEGIGTARVSLAVSKAQAEVRDSASALKANERSI